MLIFQQSIFCRAVVSGICFAHMQQVGEEEDFCIKKGALIMPDIAVPTSEQGAKECDATGVHSSNAGREIKNRSKLITAKKIIKRLFCVLIFTVIIKCVTVTGIKNLIAVK